MTGPSPPHNGPLKGIFLISTASTGQGWVLDNNLPVMVAYTGYKTPTGEYMYDETVDKYPINAPENKYDLIAEGKCSTKYSAWSKIGYNPDVTSLEEPINWTGVAYWAATTGGPMGIVSNSNFDVTGSTGCTQVFIKYLDADYIERSTVALLDGTTEVVLVDTSIARINNFQAYAGNAPIGTVTIYLTSASTSTISAIAPGLTRARNTMYTVPVSKTLYIKNIYYSAAHLGNTPRPTRFLLRSNYNETQGQYSTSLFWPISANMLDNEPIYAALDVPIKVPEKTDIYVSTITISASRNISDAS